MLALLATTVITSAADSLNPVAITQQFVLQGMVKKPKHIWFFILSTAVTNFIGGLMAYFGLGTVVLSTVGIALEQFDSKVFIAEIILGMLIFILGCYTGCKQKTKKAKRAKNLLSEIDMEKNEKQQASLKIRSVSPVSLAALGAAATLAELITAIPYFTFLAVLLNYQLSVFLVILILIIYNFIYSLPLMVLYFIYRKNQELFERFYLFIKRQIKKCSAVIFPLILILAGICVIFHGAVSLSG